MLCTPLDRNELNVIFQWEVDSDYFVIGMIVDAINIVDPIQFEGVKKTRISETVICDNPVS